VGRENKMYLSKAYVIKDTKKEFLMIDIASVKVEGEKLILSSLFSAKKIFNANILEIDFTANSVKLEVSVGGLPVD
jgi:predicted RNA-binding protein